MNVLVFTDHLQNEQPIDIHDVVNVSLDRDGLLTIDCEKDNDMGHVFKGEYRFHPDHWTHYEAYP